MRAMRKTILSVLILISAAGMGYAQQKEYGWVPQSESTFRIGPGYHNGVAVFQPHGWEAIRIRMDINSHYPVSVGVVPLSDWNEAARDHERLEHLNYDCLMRDVVKANFTCNFYASYTARIVVVRDMRRADRAIIAGAGVPFARATLNQLLANDVRVTPYRWDCTANCDLPDPPQFSWVDLRREKYKISSSLKSYGPFSPEHDNDKIRVRVKTEIPMTVAVVPSSLVDDLYAHRDQAQEILSKSSCKQYGVQSSTLECTFQLSDGDQQVVLLPEQEIRKKKKVEVEISTVKCVANCTQ